MELPNNEKPKLYTQLYHNGKSRAQLFKALFNAEYIAKKQCLVGKKRVKLLH